MLDGELRVIVLDAQPIHRPTQAYRIVDAATGELERGTVRVADMIVRQPWDTDLPIDVAVTDAGSGGSSYIR